jgi:hypothetical protein
VDGAANAALKLKGAPQIWGQPQIGQGNPKLEGPKSENGLNSLGRQNW